MPRRTKVEDRLEDLERGLGELVEVSRFTGQTRRVYAPTILVAASDASQAVRNSTTTKYLCDGIADDVQIQAANDDLPAGGGTVVFSEGTFTIAAAVNVSVSTRLMGQGRSTIFKLGFTGAILSFPDSGSAHRIYIEISDILFEGNKGNFTGNAIDCGDRGQEFTIKDCWFINVGGNVIKTTTNKKFQILGCFFGGTGNVNSANCIDLSTTGDVEIVGCNFHDSLRGVSGNTEKTSIVGNTFYSFEGAAGSQVGINLSTVAAGLSKVQIIGNTFANMDYGIRIGSTTASKGVNIIGNFFRDIERNAMFLRGEQHNVIGNYLENIAISGTGDDSHGILLAGSAQFINVISNNIDGSAHTNMGSGVSEIDAATGNNRIEFNNIIGAQTAGLRLKANANTTVRGNYGYADNDTRYKFISDMLAITGTAPLFWLPKEADTTTNANASRTVRTINYSKSIATFDDPRAWQGEGLYVHFDGVDEQASFADAADMSFGNGTVDSAFSIIALLNTDDATSSTVISKYDDDAANEEEWKLTFTANDYPRLEIYDDSVPASIGREDQTAWGDAAWHLLITTKSTTAASSGINIYKDGVVVDDADVNSGSYTATQDGPVLVRIAHHAESSSTTDFFNGKMAFILICTKELSADEVWQIKSLVNNRYQLAL